MRLDIPQKFLLNQPTASSATTSLFISWHSKGNPWHQPSLSCVLAHLLLHVNLFYVKSGRWDLCFQFWKVLVCTGHWGEWVLPLVSSWWLQNPRWIIIPPFSCLIRCSVHTSKYVMFYSEICYLNKRFAIIGCYKLQARRNDLLLIIRNELRRGMLVIIK